MTTAKINSMKKVRILITEERNLYTLMDYYNIVEKLMYHYKRVLNRPKQMEASQLLTKIRMTMIERMSVV